MIMLFFFQLQSLPVIKMKSSISTMEKIEKRLLKIVDDITILKDDETIKPNTTVEYLVGQDQRTIPQHFKATDECMLLGNGPTVRMSCGHAICEFYHLFMIIQL